MQNDLHDQITIERKHISWLIASASLFSFCLFMVGYFFGKKVAFDQFAHLLDQESLSDKIYSSLFSTYEYRRNTDMLDDSDAKTDQEQEQSEREPSQDHTDEVGGTEEGEDEAIAPPMPVDNANPTTSLSEGRPYACYYAKIAGFPTLAAAKNCAQKLEKKDIPVTIKKRSHKTARGKIITWYQLVTPTYASRDDLDPLIVRIKQQAYLKNDIAIVTSWNTTTA